MSETQTQQQPSQTATAPAANEPQADPRQPPASLLGAAPAAPTDPAASAAPPTTAVPESYEFQAPEIDGKPVEVDTAALDAFKGFAKEAGLTQAQFQALGVNGAKLIADQVAAAAAAPYTAWATMQKEWQDAIKADPDIGGEKLNASLATARLALDKFGGPELKQAWAVTGAGNNPAVIKAFVAIGRAMGENQGEIVTGKASPAQRGGNSLDAIASRLYPTAQPGA